MQPSIRNNFFCVVLHLAAGRQVATMMLLLRRTLVLHQFYLAFFSQLSQRNRSVKFFVSSWFEAEDLAMSNVDIQ